MRILYLSASNMVGTSKEKSTSYHICEIARKEFQRRYPEAEHSILELKNYLVFPCVGCGKCYDTHRCVLKDDFNEIYHKVIESSAVILVSPHYAPIPAKLAALLEKMEQITFLHWGRDGLYRSEVFGKPTGVISHGGGEAWALNSYKLMVNDTIANALDTIGLKLIPLSKEWDTGLSIPVKKAQFTEKSVFPEQQYDWQEIICSVSEYAALVCRQLED